MLSFLPIVGSVEKRAGDPDPPGSAGLAPIVLQDAELDDLRLKAFSLIQSNRLGEANRLFQKGLELAQERGNAHYIVRFRGNQANYYLKTYQYGRALKAYLMAFAEAERQGDTEPLAITAGNLASVYAMMGNPEAARTSAERALEIAQQADLPFQDRALLQLALLEARAGNKRQALAHLDRSLALGRQTSVKRSKTALDPQEMRELRALELFLVEAVRAGWTGEAEALILRIKALRAEHLTLPKTPVSLTAEALVAQQHGNLAEAATLFTDAIVLTRRLTPLGLPDAYIRRAAVRQKQGRLREALNDYRTSIELARRFRQERVAPADAFRIQAESTILDESYGGFIQAAWELVRQGRGSERIKREMFLAAESNRAASLATLLTESRQWESQLPGEYFEALTQLQTIEAALLQQDTSELRQQSRRLRLALAQWESQGGVDGAIASGEDALEERSVEQLHRRLAPDETYLSFHLPRTGNGLLWIVTRQNLTLVEVDQTNLRRLKERLRSAIVDRRQKEPDSELTRVLLSNIPATALAKRHWILALDGELFDLPFAVLEDPLHAGRFLAEQHTLRTVPGVRVLLTGDRLRQTFNGFLGVGDPVYNRADSRLRRPPRSVLSRLANWINPPADEESNGIQYNRLIGSGEEIEAISNTFARHGGSCRLLTGQNANPKQVRAAIEEQPAVIHFATHVVASRDSERHGMIALSLRADGNVDFFSPRQIYRMDAHALLVVLSGCYSSESVTLPGAGRLGLTRAWLAAGARSVAATYWPTPDNTRDFFQAFYGTLLERRKTIEDEDIVAVAEALHSAQVEMIQDNSWRSDPVYWAAFSITGRR